MIIRELTSSEYESHVPRLGKILIDAVDSAAGVSFMAPLSSEVAEDYWRRQLPDISAGTTVQFVVEENNVIAGTVLLIKAWAPNQPHRCDVAKLLVHRDFRRKGVGTLLMQALERRASGQSLKDAVLQNGPYQGLQQSIQFDRFGDTLRKLYFAEIHDGQFVLVKE